MTATPIVNTLEMEPVAGTIAAHPLYPVDQVFLWLPGFQVNDRAYCTYNAPRGISASTEVRLYEPETLHDGNGAFYSPRFPINPGTYISWHLDASPPIPFHGVPINCSLSTADLDELAHRVMLASEEDPAACPDPLTLLRNDRKCFILASLSKMGLLSGSIPHREQNPEAGKLNTLDFRKLAG